MLRSTGLWVVFNDLVHSAGLWVGWVRMLRSAGRFVGSVSECVRHIFSHSGSGIFSPCSAV